MHGTGWDGMVKILDKILGKSRGKTASAMETVGNKPYTVGWSGSMYQQVLVRSVIERFAIACSKLKPEIEGNARPRIRRAIETSPNEFQTWPQFLYRCATLYMNNTTVCVVPEYKPGSDYQIGFYPVPLAWAEVVDYDGEYWLRWTNLDGDQRAIELKHVAVVTRFQYVSDWFGDGNILANTLSMLKAQEDAQKQSINDSAQLRFIGQFNGQVREEDMNRKRDRFARDNLSGYNNTPLMVYDSTFTSIEQLKAQNWTIPSEEMDRIENNVFDYFGANRITFSSNMLEYASAASKRNMGKDMLDRGIFTINNTLEMLQMPTIGEDGDVRILRGEYKVARTFDEIAAMQALQAAASASGGRAQNSEEDMDKQEGDTIRGDSEGYGSPGDTDTGDVTSTNQDRWSENAS